MAGRRFRSKGRFGEPTGMAAAGIRRIRDRGRAGTRGRSRAGASGRSRAGTRGQNRDRGRVGTRDQGKIRVMDNKAETRDRVETHSPLRETAAGGMAAPAPADFPNAEKDRRRKVKTAVHPNKPQLPGDKITNTAEPIPLPGSMPMGTRAPIRCWVSFQPPYIIRKPGRFLAFYLQRICFWRR